MKNDLGKMKMQRISIGRIKAAAYGAQERITTLLNRLKSMVEPGKPTDA